MNEQEKTRAFEKLQTTILRGSTWKGYTRDQVKDLVASRLRDAEGRLLSNSTDPSLTLAVMKATQEEIFRAINHMERDL